MRSLRLSNFRSFSDTQRIELRPITLLVGANSSGKSSFLRFFPLLRQTVETATRSPLLWFGPLVDYGDYQKTVSSNRRDSNIGYEFELDIRPIDFRQGGTSQNTLAVSVSATLSATENTTYVSKMNFGCAEDSCQISIDQHGSITEFRANDHDILQYYKDADELRCTPGIVPVPLIRSQSQPDVDFRRAPLNLAIADWAERYAHNRTSKTKLLGYANFLKYDSRSSILSNLRHLKLRHLPEDGPPSRDFQKLRSLLFARDMSLLLTAAREQLRLFGQGVVYLGPFRTDPDRFHRHQELSVTHIEPHGENLAMFLRSLESKELQQLSDFVHEYLHVRVALERSGDHVAIFATDESGASFNLIDMGYGLSQVLPVLAQCWATAYSSRSVLSSRKKATVLAVEQPELHLHPSHQARLADMFLSTVKAARAVKPRLSGDIPPFRIVLETHSEALLSRFGELVESQKMLPTDIEVLLFEKNSNGETTISRSEYDDDGRLVNWPIGFFAP